MPVHFDPLASVASRSPFGVTLLCRLIATPAVPRVNANSGVPQILWVHGKQSLSGAGDGFIPSHSLCDAQSDSGKLEDSAELLFLAAHQLLANGDLPASDYCLQKALSLQAGRTLPTLNLSPGSSWLILASNSLLKRDFDSCETWLRQAERSLHGKNLDVTSPEFLSSAGDLFAIQACLFAQTQHRIKAGKMFSQAMDCHFQAQLFAAAAQDLVLHARLLMLGKSWNEAAARLQKAKELLEGKLPASDPDRLRLQRVISDEISKMGRHQKAIAIAESN